MNFPTMIFFNTGRMTKYQGINGQDPRVIGGGSYNESADGAEMFNFLPYNGVQYGFVEPHSLTIRIERLGASPDDAQISGLLVIWCAPAAGGGTRIVGWYKNATVYKEMQDPPNDPRRIHKARSYGFHFAMCAEVDSVLLPVEDRVFVIPRGGRGEFGQSNVWFAGDSDNIPLRKTVEEFILNFVSRLQLKES